MSQRSPIPTPPIPATGVPNVAAATSSPARVASATGPHELECLIQRELQAKPGLKFSRLIVHQCPQGVCLEGLLESNDEGLDLCQLVDEIAGVKAINRVVMSLAKPK